MKVLKRTTAFIFAMLFLLNFASAKTVELTLESKEIIVSDDGNISAKNLEAAPYINEKGRTMAPMSFFTENLEIEVEWNQESNVVFFSSGEDEVIFGDEKVLINNEPVSSDSFLEIKGGVLFIPLRFLCEALGYNLGYSTVTKKIILDKSDAVLKSGNTVINYTEFKGLFDIFYAFAYDEAIKSGASEEEIKFYAYQAAAETAISFVVMYNAFPGIFLDSEDIDFVKEAIETDSKSVTFSLPGLFALIQEKYYFTKGSPIIKSLENSPEFEKAYLENYICAKHILVEDEVLAKDLIEKIKNGEKFDALIKEYGKDPGMEKYPDGYVFAKGEMVEEFENAAFSLKDGEVSGVVESSFGYHIIKREALPKIPQDIKTAMAEDKANEILTKVEPASLLMDERVLVEKLGISK